MGQTKDSLWVGKLSGSCVLSRMMVNYDGWILKLTPFQMSRCVCERASCVWEHYYNGPRNTFRCSLILLLLFLPKYSSQVLEGTSTHAAVSNPLICICLKNNCNPGKVDCSSNLALYAVAMCKYCESVAALQEKTNKKRNALDSLLSKGTARTLVRERHCQFIDWFGQRTGAAFFCPTLRSNSHVTGKSVAIVYWFEGRSTTTAWGLTHNVSGSLATWREVNHFHLYVLPTVWRHKAVSKLSDSF